MAFSNIFHFFFVIEDSVYRMLIVFLGDGLYEMSNSFFFCFLFVFFFVFFVFFFFFFFFFFLHKGPDPGF